MEPDGRRVLHQRLVLQLLAGQPPLVGTAEVQLVAVLLRLHTAQDGAELRQLHLTDARQLVFHLLLFHLELCLVGQLLPLATAADAEMLAERLYAYITIFLISNDLCLHVRVFFSAYLQVDNVAWYSPWHKHHHVVHSGQRLPLSGKVRNEDVLQHGQWFFLSCHDVSTYDS